MKKVFSVILVASMMLSLVACGGAGETASSALGNKSSSADNSNVSSTTISDLDAIGDVQVEQELFDVVVTLPAEFVGETTQEELEKQAEDQDIYSITLNEDGSATYVMSKSQHKKLMEELAASINQSLAEIPGSESSPNVTNIEANEDYTSFKVSTTSTELNLTDSMSVLAYYMYGALYNIFNGTEADNIHVDFVNADSGEIIGSSDSSEMGE